MGLFCGAEMAITAMVAGTDAWTVGTDVLFRAWREHAGAPRRWQVATGAEAAVRARGGRVRFSVAARHELSFVFFSFFEGGFFVGARKGY